MDLGGLNMGEGVAGISAILLFRPLFLDYWPCVAQKGDRVVPLRVVMPCSPRSLPC